MRNNSGGLVPERIGVAPSRSDLTVPGHETALGKRASAIARVVFDELWPQYEGLLPAMVVRDCVDRAVQDLLGSICAEALPEMAARLVAVRLQGQLPRYGIAVE